MRLPVALLAWAQQHKSLVSEATFTEACRIADEIDKSTLRNISANDADAARKISSLFYSNRSERAKALINVTQAWLKENSMEMPERRSGGPSGPQIVRTSKSADTQSSEDIDPKLKAEVDSYFQDDPSEQDDPAPIATTPTATTVGTDPTDDAEVIHSEKDEETLGTTDGSPDLDSLETALPEPAPKTLDEAGLLKHVQPEEDAENPEKLYGPKRRWARLIIIPIVALILAALVAIVWKLGFDDTAQESQPIPTATSSATKEVEPTATAIPDPTPTEVSEQVPTPSVAAEATTAPVEAEPTAVLEPTLLADTTPILNSGAATITASTYRVSPANRVVLTGHRSAISAVTVTENGRVITGGTDSHIVDWGDDVPVTSPTRLTANGQIRALTLTKNEKILAGLDTGEIQILDPAETEEAATFSLFEADITSVIELPSEVIVAVSADGQIALVAKDATDSNGLIVAAVGEDPVAIAATPDSFLVAGGDRIIRHFVDFDPETLTLGAPSEIDVAAPITALSEVRDGNTVIAGLLDGSVATVNIETAEIITGRPQLHSSAIRTAKFFDIDGDQRLVTGGDDGTIVIWNEDLTEAQRVLHGHGDSVTDIAQLKDMRIVSASADATGRVWDLEQPLGQPTIVTHAANISVIAPAADNTVITGDINGRVLIESLDGQTDPVDFASFSSPVIAVTRMNTGAIAAGDSEGNVVISPSVVISPENLIRITLEQPMTALASHGDQETKLITGHSDGTVRVLNTETELNSVQAHEGAVSAVAGLSDGRVISAGQDKKMRVHDFENKAVTVGLHPNVVDVITVLENGSVLSGSVDGIYMWSPDEPLDSAVRFAGHHQKLLSLVQLDENTFLSSDIDGRVRRWDMGDPEAEPEELLDIPGVVNPALAISDNNSIVVGAARGFVVIE